MESTRGLRTLVRLLSRGGAVARRDGDFVRIGDASPRLAAAVLGEALSRGLVSAAQEGYVLAPAGRSWLRRELSAAGDPFREQHQERSLRPADPGEPAGPAILVDDSESPLAWLRRRKDKSGAPLISDAQFAAGERLRADFHFAQLTPRTTMNWSAAVAPIPRRGGAAGQGAELRDSVIAAKGRVSQALKSVGPELAGVLIDVCCHLQGLEAAEEARGWPQRSGKIVLQLALTRLARHYGLLAPEDAAAEAPGRILHWGAEGYRPGAGQWA